VTQKNDCEKIESCTGKFKEKFDNFPVTVYNVFNDYLFDENVVIPVALGEFPALEMRAPNAALFNC